MALALKTLRDWRGAALGVAAVGFAVALLDILIFPAYEESLAGFDEMGWVQGFIGDAGSIASPEGFLAAEFFSWIPLLLITLAVIAATGTLAGEEAEGTLELLLAQPISRVRLFWEKWTGLAAMLVLVAIASYPGFVLAKLTAGFDISAWRLLEATLNMLPISLLFLSLAALASTALPTRATAASAVIGVVVVSYFLNIVGSVAPSLDVLRKITPFYWADGGHVLVHGLDLLRAGLLLALAAGVAALATWSFARRDILSGAAEWSFGSLLRLPGRRAITDEGHAAGAGPARPGSAAAREP